QKLLESSQDSDSVEELVQSIKSDIAPPEKVYVSTPKGRVFELPQGATVVDFAYAVHTKIGHKMVGAKINGRIASLESKVNTGDIVEILTSSDEDKAPNRDWLKIAATNQAKSKIRSWFKKERREENIIQGRLEAERELRRTFIRLEPKELEELLLKVIERKNFPLIEDFYAAIGYGGVSMQKYLPRLREEYQRLIRAQQEELPAEYKKITSDKGVVVEGIDNCLIKFAQCCHPLPGDEIVGYITRGSGLTIHKLGCVNVPKELSASPEPDRWLCARWAAARKAEYVGALTIHTVDRTGMAAFIAQWFYGNHIDISSLSLITQKEEGTATIFVGIGVSGRDHLESVLHRLRQIDGVISVRMDW
ncbi:MAG: TGS domain-containing protein, partial [Oscillospiraceae bacterium]|nr:TGS domain-containing protein [Oscillospiraceae bacterium]